MQSSENPYVALLVKLYRFLARRTESKFNAIVLHRLYMSRLNQATMSLSRIATYAKGKESQIVVIVGRVTNDSRFHDMTKMTICALKFTDTARARIEKAGGECLTFDQLAVRCPTGSNTLLLRGSKWNREAVKHFGAVGVPGSHVKPYGTKKQRKLHIARGRRNSKGFKT